MGTMRKATTLLVSLAVAAGGGLAGGAAWAKEKSNKTDQSRRVCRSVTPVGTRLSTRVCRPAAEWAEMEKAEQQGVHEGQTDGFMVRNNGYPDSEGMSPR